MKKLFLFALTLAISAITISAQQVEIYPQIDGEFQINSVTYSPDGKYFLTVDRGSSRQGMVKIWDAENGRELKILYTGYSGANSRTYCEYAEYSPDGRTILLIINTEEGRNYGNGNIRIVEVETGRTVRTIRGHTGRITSASFSHDGRRIVSGGADKTVKIWNVEDGQEIRTITGHTDTVNSVAWGLNNRQVASGSDDKTLRIWNVETGQQIRSITTESYSRIKWSSDGNRIISNGYLSSSHLDEIVIWDANTGRQINSIRKIGLSINNEAFSTNSQNIVSGGQRITIYDINGRNERDIGDSVQGIRTNMSINSIAYNANDSRIITGHKDGSIRIWDTQSGRNILTFGTRRVTNIPSATWSPDSRQIAMASGNTIKIWDFTTGRLIRTINGNNANNVVWSPDGRKLAASTGSSVTIWDVESGQVLRTINGPFARAGNSNNVSSITWSPNGRMIATGSGGMVKAWNPDTGQQLWEFIRYNPAINFISFSPDSQRLFAEIVNDAVILNANNGQEIKTYTDRSNSIISPDWKQFFADRFREGFSIYDATTGNQIRQGKRLYEMADITRSYSPDGKRIMIGQGNSAYIYDVETTNQIATLSSLATVKSASYSPDNKWILTASDDGAVRIWSAETFFEKARLVSYNDGEWLAMTPDGYYVASARGDQYLNARVGNTVTGIDRYRSAFNKPATVQARLSNNGRMTAHTNDILSVAVNPAGTRIASVSRDGSIKLWDLESGKELRTITGIGGTVNAISFSPDGRTLIHGTGDKIIRIWDAETGRQVRTITGHTDYVNEARYSPDGRRIASAADDKLIKIWDAETGREIRTLSGHTDSGGPGVIAWKPDGRQLASGSQAEEKAIRIWDVESGRTLYTIPDQGGRISALVYSPDGNKIASCSPDVEEVRIWDAQNGRLIRGIAIRGMKLYSLAWSPDGKQIAVGNIHDINYCYISIYDTETGTKIRDFSVGSVPQSLTWTPDGRRIVTASNYIDARFIRVYDALSGMEL